MRLQNTLPAKARPALKRATVVIPCNVAAGSSQDGNSSKRVFTFRLVTWVRWEVLGTLVMRIEAGTGPFWAVSDCVDIAAWLFWGQPNQSAEVLSLPLRAQTRGGARISGPCAAFSLPLQTFKNVGDKCSSKIAREALNGPGTLIEEDRKIRRGLILLAEDVMLVFEKHFSVASCQRD
jgi:hypothetical protein